MAETTFYSKYDIAAQMALINMLKASFIDQPEVYRTLLAMMCDYDPRNTSFRNMILRYMKLMVKDQMLLKCLLMSLPEGLGGLSAIPRAMPVHSPAPERIFLPLKMQQSPVKGKKLKHGSGLNRKPVKLKLTQIMPKRLLKASTTSTITAASEFLPGCSHGIQYDDGTSTKLKAQPSVLLNKEFQTDSIKRETRHKSVSDDMLCRASTRKRSITEILKKSDDPKQVLVNIMGTTGIESRHQGHSQGQAVPQQFITSGIRSTPYQCHGIPLSQQLPSLVRLPTGMAIRPVLPWQPISLIQPSVVRQNLASSLAQNEVKTGMDLTTNPKKSVIGPKASTDQTTTTQSSSLLSMSKGKVAAVEPFRKQHGGIKTVAGQSRSSQILQHENVDKSNATPVPSSLQKVAPMHPGNIDNGSLQALAELTSRIGEETKRPIDSRIYLGARKSASTGSLSWNDDIKKETSVAPKTRPAILTAGPSTISVPQSMQSFTRSSSHMNKAIGQEDGNTMMKSFPYRQEIKLLDGKYFLHNSNADKKILSLKSDKKLSHPTIRESLQAPLLHDLTASSSHIDPTGHINKQSTKLHTANEMTDLPKTGQNSDSYSKCSMTSQTEDINSPANPTCAYTISNKSGEEKTCTFQVSNSTTNRLITELLRKRALSDCTPSIYSPSKKQVRAKPESQIPDKEDQTGTHCMSVNDFGVKHLDATKTTDDFDRQCVDGNDMTLQNKNDASVGATVTKCEDEEFSGGNTSANEVEARVNTTDVIACEETEADHFKLIQNNLEMAHEMMELKLRATNLKQSLIKMRINHIGEETDISGLEEDQSAADITSSDIESDSSDFDDFYDSVFIN